MKYKTRFGKAVYITVLAMLLMAVFVYAAVPSQTFLSDTTSYFKGLTGFGTDSPAQVVDVVGNIAVTGTVDGRDISADINQAVTTTSAPTFATLNTGQGAYELYAMNQNVRTSDGVTFGTVSLSSGEILGTDGSSHYVKSPDTILFQTNTAVSTITPMTISPNGQVTIDQNTANKGLVVTNTNNAGSISAAYFQNDNFGDATNYAEFALVSGDSRSNRIYRNINSTNTGGPVLQVIQDNAGDDQPALSVQQDGSGQGVYVANAGTGDGYALFQSGVLNPGKYGAVFYTNSLQTNGAMLQVKSDNSGASATVAEVVNDGTGNGIFADCNGNGICQKIDSEATTFQALEIQSAVANDYSSFSVAHDAIGNGFAVQRNDDLNEDVTIKIGSYYLWVDSTGDLRIKNSNPTSDTDGTVVGTQS